MKQAYLYLQGALNEGIQYTYGKLIDILPNAAAAVAIVVSGILVAAVLYLITVRVLRFFAVDKLVGKTPMEKILRSFGIKRSISEIVGLLVFSLVGFFTLIIAFEKLDLEPVAAVLTAVTKFIPQLIVALLAIVIGMIGARALETFVSQALAKAQMRYAKSIGRSVYIVVLVYVFLLVFRLLGIELPLITEDTVILLSAIVLIIGAGVMFAARTLIENMLACYQLKKLLTVGQRIEILDVEGRVKVFTATSVIVETHGGNAVLPAALFFKNTYSLIESEKHGH